VQPGGKCRCAASELASPDFRTEGGNYVGLRSRLSDSDLARVSPQRHMASDLRICARRSHLFQYFGALGSDPRSLRRNPIPFPGGSINGRLIDWNPCGKEIHRESRRSGFDRTEYVQHFCTSSLNMRSSPRVSKENRQANQVRAQTWRPRRTIMQSIVKTSAIPFVHSALCLDCNSVNDAYRECSPRSSKTLMNLSPVMTGATCVVILWSAWSPSVVCNLNVP